MQQHYHGKFIRKPIYMTLYRLIEDVLNFEGSKGIQEVEYQTMDCLILNISPWTYILGNTVYLKA